GLPGRRARRVRGRRARRRALGRARSMEALRVRAADRCRERGSRSGPRAAVGRELHQQLEDAPSSHGARVDQVVARLDGVAAGLSAIVDRTGVSDLNVFGAWRDGVRRVNRAPLVLVGVWLMTLLVSLPLALVLRGMIAQHLGDSLAADSAAAGVNYEWMQEFADQASGIGVTFKPTIIGFGAVLDNLSAFLDGTPRPPVIIAVAAAYIALWIFVAGGIIDRLARNRTTGPHGFFSASGVYFGRFLRLGAAQLVVYGLLFLRVHPYLFGQLYPRLTRD